MAIGIVAFALFLVFVAFPANAQSSGVPAPIPPCVPQEFGGSGTPMLRSPSADPNNGQWIAWWCPNTDGTWTGYAAVGLYGWTFKHPSSLVGLSPADIFKAYWAANVEVYANDPDMLALRQEALDALNANRPAPIPKIWKVAPFPGYTVRNTYPMVNGSRSFSVNGTIPIGSTCDCTAVKITEGNLTFCSVATATVAVCSTP